MALTFYIVQKSLSMYWIEKPEINTKITFGVCLVFPTKWSKEVQFVNYFVKWFQLLLWTFQSHPAPGMAIFHSSSTSDQ